VHAQLQPVQVTPQLLLTFLSCCTRQAGKGLSNVHIPDEVGLKLEEVGSSLTSFGKSLLAGTKEFIDTVSSSSAIIPALIVFVCILFGKQ